MIETKKYIVQFAFRIITIIIQLLTLCLIFHNFRVSEHTWPWRLEGQVCLGFIVGSNWSEQRHRMKQRTMKLNPSKCFDWINDGWVSLPFCTWLKKVDRNACVTRTRDIHAHARDIHVHARDIHASESHSTETRARVTRAVNYTLEYISIYSLFSSQNIYD